MSDYTTPDKHASTFESTAGKWQIRLHWNILEELYWDPLFYNFLPGSKLARGILYDVILVKAGCCKCKKTKKQDFASHSLYKPTLRTSG
jgi:hypothetical protein